MVFERRDRAIKGLLALFVLTLQCVLSGCSLYFDEEHDKNVLNGMLVHEAYAELDDTLAKAEKKHRQHKLTAAQWEGRWASLQRPRRLNLVSSGGWPPKPGLI